MERAMAEMEREISTLSEENPNPRQIARLMRTMSQASGRRLPEAMEQMISRLEKGEDPERLEEEFGDSMEDAFGEDPDAEAVLAAGFRRARRPVRDPKLYEMSEYL
jgi:hypothetical protein